MFSLYVIPCFQVTSDNIFKNDPVLDCLHQGLHVRIINEFIISVPVDRWKWIS